MAATIEWRANELWMVVTEGEERAPAYSLAFALGGWLRGFRAVGGRFESRLTFRDIRRLEPAEHLLRLAFDNEANCAPEWIRQSAGNRIEIAPPPDLDADVRSACDLLRTELSHRRDGKALIGPPPESGRPIVIECDHPLLARWLVAALSGLLAERLAHPAIVEREATGDQDAIVLQPVTELAAEQIAAPLLVQFAKLDHLAVTSPDEAERECRRLLESSPCPEHVPRLRATLGRALMGLERCEEALAEFRQALTHGPSAEHLFDWRGALRELLIVRGCTAGEDEVVLPWLVQAPRIGADSWLLLLCAEAATVRDRSLAAGLIARAVPGRGAVIGPDEADQFVRDLLAVGARKDRLQSLLVALDRAAFSAGSEAERAIAELRFALDPTDGEVLTRLIEGDVESVHWLPDRLERLFDAFELTVPSADRRSRLARLAVPLSEGIQFTYAEYRVPIDTGLLYQLTTLAIEAALAAGNRVLAGSILRAAYDSKVRRLECRQLVDLADLLAVHPAILEGDESRHLIDVYLGVGCDLARRLHRGGDLELLGEIVRALEALDRDCAEMLREQWQAQTPAEDRGDIAEATDGPPPLIGRQIVIFGGDPQTQRGAVERLTELGAKVSTVPPAYEQNLNVSEIRQKLRGADLVIDVWRKQKHRDGDALDAALAGLSPAPVRRHAAGSGKTSIVRVALDWVACGMGRGREPLPGYS